MHFGFVLLREMQSWDLLAPGGRLNIVKDTIPIDSLPDTADAQAGLQNRKQQGVDTELIFRQGTSSRAKREKLVPMWH